MTQAWAELEMIHEAVEQVPCSRCHAPAGKRCVNPVTGRKAKVPCLARARAVDCESNGECLQ